MRPIHAGLHSVLDLLTVVTFILAPSLLGFVGTPATLAYVLAGVHLALTLATRYPPRARGVISFPMHGSIELLVGVLLVILPFVLGWTGAVRMFYAGSGIVFCIVWTLTDYRGANLPVTG